MAHRGLPDRFEHAQEAVHVVRRIGERIAQGVSDAGLGGEMAHDVEPLFRTEGGNCLGGGQVDASESQPGVCGNRFQTVLFGAHDPEFLQTVQLQADIVVAVEVVDPEHTVPEFDHAAGQVEADEAGYAGNENFHCAA